VDLSAAVMAQGRGEIDALAPSATPAAMIGSQGYLRMTEYLTQDEAATLLRVSERSLERWRVEGQGPLFRRFGRRVVYARSDLFAWADQRVFQSTAAAKHGRAHG
jgi:hypothetical protein